MNRDLHQMPPGTGDPAPVGIVNPHGTSPFLLIGDHAGNAVPGRLAGLGLPAEAVGRHIGWDIGVMGLGALLAGRLDAPFIHQRFSRLVIDCNRDPARPDAMPETSDGTAVPGNRRLDEAARAARVAAIHTPYHEAIAAEIARRDAAGQATILIALHSFTPHMAGMDRPWQVGVLHGGGNARFAARLLALLQADGRWTVGDNAPYRMDDTDYTVPRHAFPSGRPYAELEIRQDLIGDADGQWLWADVLADCLPAALGE